MKYVKLVIKIIIIMFSFSFLYKIKTLNDNYYYVCLGNIDQAVIKCALWVMISLCAVSFIGSGNIKFWRIRIAIVLSVLIYGICHCASTTTLVFESPSRTNTLVIREKVDPIRSFVFSSNSFSDTRYYRKESTLTNKMFSVAYFPSLGAFKNGKYSVEWLTEDIAYVNFILYQYDDNIGTYEVTLGMNDIEKEYWGYTVSNGVRRSNLRGHED